MYESDIEYRQLFGRVVQWVCVDTPKVFDSLLANKNSKKDEGQSFLHIYFPLHVYCPQIDNNLMKVIRTFDSLWH